MKDIEKLLRQYPLPGIVGATLLAASCAIGETMIVVLAAGIAANLALNPFEAVSTVTGHGALHRVVSGAIVSKVAQ